MKIKRSLLFTLFMLSVTSHLQAAVVISTFDTDDESWIGIPGEGSVSYESSGGNPSGHIRVTDIGVGGPLGSGAIAPSKFSGDLSVYLAGMLSVDMATFSGRGATFPIFGTVRISGAGDEAFFDLAANAPGIGNWISYTAPLTATAWSKTESEWTAILSDVTEIAISTDAFNGGDTIGLDNFSLTTVPLLSAIWLFFSAIAGLKLLNVQRKPQS